MVTLRAQKTQAKNITVQPFHFTYYSLTLLFLLSACSTSKQISRSANILLTDSALVAAHVGICFFEPATGKTWYSHNADKYFIPASNTKLFTLYAGLRFIPDSLPGIRYYELNDTTHLEPTGDPTLLHPDFKKQPLLNFLQARKNIILHLPSFKEYLGKGWAWDDYREGYMAQRSSMPVYGNVISIKRISQDSIAIHPRLFSNRKLLHGQLTPGFEVDRSWDTNHLLIKKGNRQTAEVPFRPDDLTIAALLADTLQNEVIIDNQPPIRHNLKTVYSQPADSMYKLMMHRSDNFFAEQTLLMASLEKLGEMNDGKMISYILRNDLKDAPQLPKWVDGSGLSRYNLFSPKSFVDILNKMQNEFGLERLKNILPTGGTGTLESYYLGNHGSIYAKTGTLNNNVALSGFLITRKTKLIFFSIMVNNFPSGATPVRKAIEKFVRGIIKNY